VCRYRHLSSRLYFDASIYRRFNIEVYYIDVFKYVDIEMRLYVCMYTCRYVDRTYGLENFGHIGDDVGFMQLDRSLGQVAPVHSSEQILTKFARSANILSITPVGRSTANQG
jgi:hypothetical protein